MEIDKIKDGRTKQKFTGKIINSKDFVVNIHGVLYHESLPNGHKLIDVKIEEKRKANRFLVKFIKESKMYSKQEEKMVKMEISRTLVIKVTTMVTSL